MLADRGELDFYAPVAKYWPEFAAAGKERGRGPPPDGHTAGLAGWTEPLEAEDLADWERCTSLLAAQEPWWEPGTASGYHAVTQGYLIGEVVRRITGETIGTWFASEVAEPLGADFHIGLPAVRGRPGRRRVIPPPPIDVERHGLGGVADDLAGLHQPAHSTPPTRSTSGGGGPRSPPPTGMATPARWRWSSRSSPARGEARGMRLLSRPGCEPIFDEQIHGTDLVLGLPNRFGMGYGLRNEFMPIGPRACYWGGYGGSLIVMDLDARLTVCYVMNRMESGVQGDFRGANIMFAAAAALARGLSRPIRPTRGTTVRSARVNGRAVPVSEPSAP